MENNVFVYENTVLILQKTAVEKDLFVLQNLYKYIFCSPLPGCPKNLRSSMLETYFFFLFHLINIFSVKAHVFGTTKIVLNLIEDISVRSEKARTISMFMFANQVP